MARSIFYKIIQVMSRKNVSSLPSRKARLAELLFYSYAAQCRVPCMMLWRPPGLVRLFYFIFFPLFTASILTPGFMPGGKDKLRGNTPSLPAAASRFLIDAESGKKQSLGERGGRRKEQCPFQSHGKVYLRHTGLGIYCLILRMECVCMNRIEITARLTKDPEITFCKNGRAVAKFSVAENVYDKREKATKAQFFNVIAFGKTAEIIGDTLNKGNKIHIGGNVEVRQYEKDDGTKGIWVQILLREFEYCEKKEQPKKAQVA